MKNVGSPLRSERRRFPAVHPSMFFDPEDTVTLEESIRVTEIEQCVCSKIEPRLMDFYGASSGQQIYLLMSCSSLLMTHSLWHITQA